MIKRFLRLFKGYRALESDEAYWIEVTKAFESDIAELQKKAESDAALIESLNRYIEALEGRDKERLKRIGELERLCAECHEYIVELKGRLSGITPREGKA